MTFADMKQAVEAAGMTWQEEHYRNRRPTCPCRFCFAIKLAGMAFDRGLEARLSNLNSRMVP